MPRDFATAVLDVVASIPPGKVMTYGDVAAVVGSRAARAVGQVMARGAHDLPWWRVVQASGRVAKGHEDDAVAILRRENTPLIEMAEGWRVDLSLARHSPE